MDRDAADESQRNCVPIGREVGDVAGIPLSSSELHVKAEFDGDKDERAHRADHQLRASGERRHSNSRGHRRTENPYTSQHSHHAASNGRPPPSQHRANGQQPQQHQRRERMNRDVASPASVQHYAGPRAHHGQHHHQRSERRHRHSSEAPALFSKERFVQANYRFCVDPEQSYAESMADADRLVPWEHIELILVVNDARESEPRCPICLDSFSAPVMTRCGHCFCLTCLVQHMSLSKSAAGGRDGDDVCKCPLCWERVRLQHVRIVQLRESVHSVEGGEQRLVLLSRPRHSIVPSVGADRDERTASSGELRQHDPTEVPYARILYTNEPLLMSVLEECNQSILRTVLESDDKARMAPLGHTAVNFVQEQKRRVEERLCRARARAGVADELEAEPKPEPSSTLAGSNAVESTDDGQAPPSVKYFYQVESGENVFLHPLNTRCLLNDYEVYERFPSALEGKVLELEHRVMSSELRKRYRFLSHLPLGCEFSLCELDLSPQLSKATMNKFRGEMAERKRRRQRRQQEEKRESRQMERRYARQWDGSKGFLEDFHRQYEDLHLMPFPMLADEVDNSGEAFPTLAGEIVADVGDDSRLAEPSTSPPDLAFSTYAAITRNMGFYPELGGAAPNASTSPPTVSTASPRAHAKPSNEGSSQAADGPPSPPSMAEALATASAAQQSATPTGYTKLGGKPGSRRKQQVIMLGALRGCGR